VPATIKVQVTTKPAGAEVLLDGKVLGKTPLHVELPGAEAEVTLTIRRKGYTTEERVISTANDQALDVALAKKAKRPRGLGNIGTIGHGSGTGKGVGRGFILS
jgi:hypothetical protein